MVVVINIFVAHVSSWYRRLHFNFVINSCLTFVNFDLHRISYKGSLHYMLFTVKLMEDNEMYRCIVALI
jgi:hypothetical protein